MLGTNPMSVMGKSQPEESNVKQQVVSQGNSDFKLKLHHSWTSWLTALEFFIEWLQWDAPQAAYVVFTPERKTYVRTCRQCVVSPADSIFPFKARKLINCYVSLILLGLAGHLGIWMLGTKAHVSYGWVPSLKSPTWRNKLSHHSCTSWLTTNFFIKWLQWDAFHAAYVIVTLERMKYVHTCHHCLHELRLPILDIWKVELFWASTTRDRSQCSSATYLLFSEQRFRHCWKSCHSSQSSLVLKLQSCFRFSKLLSFWHGGRNLNSVRSWSHFRCLMWFHF